MKRQYQLSRRSALDRLPAYELSGVLLREVEPYSSIKGEYTECGGDEVELRRATWNGRPCILYTRTWHSRSPYWRAGQWEGLYWNEEDLEVDKPIEV
jgi:hypothetical protein